MPSNLNLDYYYGNEAKRYFNSLNLKKLPSMRLLKQEFRWIFYIINTSF